MLGRFPHRSGSLPDAPGAPCADLTSCRAVDDGKSSVIVSHDHSISVGINPDIVGVRSDFEVALLGQIGAGRDMQDAVAAIGHTDADAATASQAIDAGARYATHLFNAMPPLGHREPGTVGAVLADERVTIGLIADGVHVHRTRLAKTRQGLARANERSVPRDVRG